MDPAKTPVINPPPGTESKFIDPPNQLVAIYVTSALVLALPAIGISARLFVRLVVIPGHRIEDYLSYFAFASFVPYVAVILHLSGMGLTRHLYDISLAQIPNILYWTNIVYSIYSVPTAAAKLSVLFQLKSIFTTGARNAVYWVIVVSIVTNLAFYISLFFSYVFQCSPRDRIWLGEAVAGTCVDAVKVNLSSGILNIISDVEALLIPAWAIWHLSMPVKRKVAAMSVFGVSLIAIAVGIGGIAIRVRVITDIDQTWWLTKLALIATSEISIVIFVGCMPFFSRIYRRYRGPGPTATDARPKSKVGIATFGSSERSGNSRKNYLTHTLAKYMGPRGVGMTTLGSQGDPQDEDEFELRKHVASTATASATTPVAYTHTGGDAESGGGEVVVSNPNGGAQNNIWKTSQVDQTYARQPGHD